jgi:Icc-related predicted phosphoesterase
MRIAVISDLHLDFSDLTLPGGDVLILSGDVCEARHLKKAMYNKDMVLLEHERRDQRPDRYYRFFEEECSKYREVVMVMGNHEHYGFQYQKTYAHIASQLPDNVTLLENQTHTIDDIVFVGATLWTDMNNGDPLTMFHMKSAMNDYRQITQFNEAKNVYHRLDPERTVEDHYKSRDYIKQVVENDPTKKYVVVTHHAPSKASIKPQYAGDTLMNGAYSSDLSDFILDHPQIKLWTHGHTHDVFDYMIGSTRVICNPRGYKGYEERAEQFDPTLGFEI